MTLDVSPSSIASLWASLALFQSEDGITWQKARHLLASDLTVKWQDGTSNKVAHLERPQLLFDENGEPVALYAACAVTSPFKANGHSFNIHIPLKGVNDFKVQERRGGVH